MERRLALIGAAAVLFAVGGLPLFMMLWRSVNVDGQFTLELYAKVLSTAAQWRSVQNTLTLEVTLFSVVIGVPLGMLLGKTDLPGRLPLLIAICLPLLVPPYVLAIGWSNVLAPFGGFAASIGPARARALGEVLFGLAGAVGVLGSALAPIIVILTMVCVRAVNPRLEEAALMIGGWPAVLRHVTLPMIWPGVLFGAMLVFLLTLGEVGVPLYLRYPVFPVRDVDSVRSVSGFRCSGSRRNSSARHRRSAACARAPISAGPGLQTDIAHAGRSARDDSTQAVRRSACARAYPHDSYRGRPSLSQHCSAHRSPQERGSRPGKKAERLCSAACCWRRWVQVC